MLLLWSLFKDGISPRRILVAFLNLWAFETRTVSLALTPWGTLTTGSLVALQHTSLAYALGKLYLPNISSNAAYTYGVVWVR